MLYSVANVYHKGDLLQMDSMLGTVLFAVFIILDAILFGFGSATRVANISEISKGAEEGDKLSEKLLKMLYNDMKLHCTIQISAMIMNIIVGSVLLNIFSVKFGGSIFTQSVVAIVMMLVVAVFGIMIPIKVAGFQAEKTLYSLYGAVNIILIILSPIIFVVNLFGDMFLRMFGINPDADVDNVTEEEILTMVNEGHEQGVIEAEEAEMINNIFEYGDKDAVDIMTHRKNILAIDGNSTLEEAVSFMLHENNSRYPIYDGDIDNIVGIVHLKDALKEYGNRAKAEMPIKDISEVVFEALLVPVTRNINDLLKMMQQRKLHMVIVVDEYGQTAGLVTMEDILEEIVGNILDEHDDDEEQIQIQEDNSYVVDGMTLLEDLEDELSLEFDVEDINTINGFLTLKCGKIPTIEQVGTTIDFKGYTFAILSVKGRVIKKVEITKINE